MQKHIFAPVILREYDIRGIVGESLTERDALALGHAFGTFVRRTNGSRICVGYDGRDSSPGFADAVAQGLKETGIAVENIGLGPSPMLYFAVKDRGADAGIMVTGSHNPADYNGFKMMLRDAPVFGDSVRELGRIAASGDFETGAGSSKNADIRDTYTDRLLKDFMSGRPLKIAWDAGNGAAGEILRRLTRKLPGEHILLYDDIDGRFPNHHPDPTVDKNLNDLRRAVMDNNCDLGIAFDGDGDRIGVVDETGNILRCDTLLALYAKDVLSRHPGAAIIGDVKCSQVLFDEIARLGGRPVMWKTGHSLVKAKMAEEKAPLAGELSGHIFFADSYYGFDDALYCAVRLMNIVGADEAPLSALTAHLPKTHSTPEIRIDVPEEDKFGLVPKIATHLKTWIGRDFHIDDIDGIRVTAPQGWWLLRPSNTQNALVCRIEADSAQALAELKTMVEKEVCHAGYGFSVE